MAIVSTSETWDPSRNKFIKTTTIKVLSSDEWPTIPADAVDVTRSESDGEKTLSYKEPTDADGGGSPPGGSPTTYNYQIQTSVSTEPLLTFWKFQEGQPWALDDYDFEQIKKGDSGEVSWNKIRRGHDLTGSVPPGLWKYSLWSYARLREQGIESFLSPTVTLHETYEADTIPELTEIGKIASVPNAPALPEGANWLFMGMTADALPNGKWKVSNEYRASGKNGWNAELYGDTSEPTAP